MTPSHKENFITTKEAGEISGYTPDYLARLARGGKIVGRRVGHSWLIDSESLTHFLGQQGERKIDYARALARARETEYRAHRSAIHRATKALTKQFSVPQQRLTAATSSLRSQALALSVALMVVVSGALVARAAALPRLAHMVTSLASEAADGFSATFGNIPSRIVARIEKAGTDMRAPSERAATNATNASAEVASSFLTDVNLSPLQMAIDDERTSRITLDQYQIRFDTGLVSNSPVHAPAAPITIEDVWASASAAYAFVTTPSFVANALARAYVAFGADAYAAISASFSAYRSLIDRSGAETLALAAASRDTLATTPRLVDRVNLAFGTTIIEATHAAIHADVATAYGVATVAPASARVAVALMSTAGDTLIGVTARVPELAATLYLRATGVPATLAPRMAQAAFGAEYAAAARFITLTGFVSENYLALVEGTGRLAYTGTTRTLAFVDTVHTRIARAPATLENAYLGTLGKGALTLNTLPLLAAALPTLALRSLGEAGFSLGERAALAVYETLNNFVRSTTGALAFFLAPPPTIVLPTPDFKHPALTSAPPLRTPASGPSISNSYPTYTTIVQGVSADSVNQSLTALRTDVLATAAGMLRPVAAQGVTNMNTIQQVNMIQDLSNLIVRNGDFRGGTFSNGSLASGILVSATTGSFTNLTGGSFSAGTASLATTTITGDLAVSGALTATSTLTVTGLTTLGNASTSQLTNSGSTWLTGLSASSLLATDANKLLIATTSIGVSNLALPKGNVIVGSDAGVAQATSTIFISSTGNLGIGTTSPYALLSIGGNVVVGASAASGTLGDLYLPKLGTATGTFIAVDATGKVIATTTPTSGGMPGGSLGQLQWNSNSTFAGISTTSLTLSGFPASIPAGYGKLVGGSDTTFTWWGLATTSQPSSSNLLVSNGTSGVYGIATTSASCGTGVSCTGFAVLGGSNPSFALAALGSAGVLGAPTATTPTVQATSTLYGTGTGGQVLGWSNATGGLAFVATSTGGGAPGGSLGQLQWNSNSTFAGVSTSTLTATGLLSISNSPSIIGASGAVVTLPLTKGNVIVGSDAGVAQATSTLFISSTGNVGIGTTSPATKFSVGGAAGDTTGHGYFTGGLGVGVLNTVAGTLQTSGAATFGGALTVNGQCVTADTKLRRRRRKRKGEEADPEKGEWEDGGYIYDTVMVKDVRAGDEIASMHQITGRIVWSRVNALMFMGTKDIWTLRTKSGRLIRTTENHPYFVRVRSRAPVQKLYRFEVDMSMKIEDYTADSFIGVANTERAHVVRIPKAVKQSLRDSLRTYSQRRRMLSAVFAAGIVEAVSVMPERVHELVVDYEYSGYEAAITSVIKTAFPHIDVHFEKIGKKSPAHLAGYKALQGKLVPHSTVTEEALRRNAESALRATFSSNPKRAGPPVGPQALSLPSRIFDGEQFVKEGVWTLVKELRPGREIAVVYGEGEHARVAWEPIISIAIQQPEPVYDIEVEGTHNFIGNGIVAHNTAVFNQASSTMFTNSGSTWLTGLSASSLLATDANKLLVSTTSIGVSNLALAKGNFIVGDDTGVAQATSTIFISSTGNLAIAGTGTTTLAGFLDVNGTGTNATSTFASNLWVKGTLRTGTGSMYLNDNGLSSSDGNIALSRNGTSYLNGGNVGIASTSPWGLLSVNANGIGSAPQFVVGSSTQTSFVITNDGKVGIGTSSPSTTLDVQGNIQVSGNVISPVQISTTTDATEYSNAVDGVFTLKSTLTLSMNGNYLIKGITLAANMKSEHTNATARYELFFNSDCTSTTGIVLNVGSNYYKAVDAYGVGAINLGLGTSGNITLYGCLKISLYSGNGKAWIKNQLLTVQYETMPSNMHVSSVSDAVAYSTSADPITLLTTFSPIAVSGNRLVKAVYWTGQTHYDIAAGEIFITTDSGCSRRIAAFNTSSGSYTWALSLKVTSPDLLSAGTNGNITFYTCAMNNSSGGTQYVKTQTIYVMYTDNLVEVLNEKGMFEFNSSGSDVAEYISGEPDLEPGTIVVADPARKEYVVKATKPYQNALLGVVSTNPFLINTASQGNVAVALAGRVPVRVSTEAGSIKIGDRIAISSLPGIGMKATTSGETVGIALDAFDGENSTTTILPDGSQVKTGEVVVFIKLEHTFASSQFTIDSTGNVGIGTNTPNHTLDVAGDIGAIAFVNTSTRDAKTDITYLSAEQASTTLAKLERLQVAQYRYKIEKQNDPLRLGFIAEDAQTVAPEILSADGKGVDLYKLATFTLAGVQALASRVDAHEIRLVALEDRMAKLESGAVGMATTSPFSLSTSTLLDSLKSLGVDIMQGLAHFVKIAADNLQVGSPAHPTGITMYDKTTGQPYCFQVDNGAATTTPGACADIALASVQAPVVTTTATATATTTTDSAGSTTLTTGSSPQATTTTATATDSTSSPQATTTASADTTPPAVSDVEPPVVTLVGAAALEINVGDAFTDPGATALDDTDGDITTHISVSGAVDATAAGLYELTYTATDAALNTGSVSRVVTVLTTSSTPTN